MTRRSDIAATPAEDPNLAARIKASDPAAIRTVVETYLAQILRAARSADG